MDIVKEFEAVIHITYHINNSNMHALHLLFMKPLLDVRTRLNCQICRSPLKCPTVNWYWLEAVKISRLIDQIVWHNDTI